MISIIEGKFPLSAGETVAIVLRSTRLQWTAACLDSIERCITQPVEVNIVPDGQHIDNLSEILERYRYKPEGTFDIRIFSPIAGVDLYNYALSQVRASILVMIDDSVMVTPDWLTRLLWPFYDDPTLGITGAYSPLSIEPDGSSAISYRTMGELYQFSRETARINSGKWEYVAAFHGPLLVCKYAVLEEVGGLDFSLRTFVERMIDWCIRGRRQGYGIALCHDVFVHVFQTTYPGVDNHADNRCLRLRQKWHIDEGMDLNSALSKINLALTSVPSLIPLNLKTLCPPLITIVVHDQGTSIRELFQVLHDVDAQSYPAIEVLMIYSKEISARSKLFQWLKHKSATGIWLNGRPCDEAVYRGAWYLARGQYITYLEAGQKYERDYVHRLVEAIHRTRAMVSYTVSETAERVREDTKAKKSIPLASVMHLHPSLQPIYYLQSNGEKLELLLGHLEPYDIEAVPGKG